MKRLVKNSIKCVSCGDIITSESVHDFKWCSCGRVAVDGGICYAKRCFTDSTDDFIDLSEYKVEEDIKYV